MLLILYSSIISYMLFFTICIAPPVNIVLDRKNSSKLLRKIFPRNFWFGCVLSFISTGFSLYSGNTVSLIISTLILSCFIVNLFFIMPAINSQADLVKENNTYSKKFKILHSISVALYLISIILALFAIYYIF